MKLIDYVKNIERKVKKRDGQAVCDLYLTSCFVDEVLTKEEQGKWLIGFFDSGVDRLKEVAGMGYPLAQTIMTLLKDNSMESCDKLGDMALDHFYKLATSERICEALYYFGGYYEDEAYSYCNLDTSTRMYSEAANQGYAKAQVKFGDCCIAGRCSGKCDDDALEWYMKAYKQGNVEAALGLGNCHKSGRIIRYATSKRKAVKWYKKAAANGNMVAQCHLGSCYMAGEGAFRNRKKAAELFKLSAEQGYATAQYSLGYCYANGYGVEKDDELAKKWYEEARANGYQLT